MTNDERFEYIKDWVEHSSMEHVNRIIFKEFIVDHENLKQIVEYSDEQLDTALYNLKKITEKIDILLARSN